MVQRIARFVLNRKDRHASVTEILYFWAGLVYKVEEQNYITSHPEENFIYVDSGSSWQL